MNRAHATEREGGFSLLELMIAACIFVILCGAAFGLLAVSQKSYQNESQVLSSFQEARLGMDQIVRDVNDSGYPPRNQFSFATLPPASSYASTPFAWMPGYSVTAPPVCTVAGGAGGCTTPSNFDLIVETDIDPPANNGVEWIHYQLIGTTLYRGITSKAGTDPTIGAVAPFVQNVMNQASAAQIAQFQAVYPAMFPGGNPVPIFAFTCDTPAGPQDCSSPAAAGYNLPTNIRDVSVTLIVMTPTPDIQTGAPRLVELQGRGRRINPNQ